MLVDASAAAVASGLAMKVGPCMSGPFRRSATAAVQSVAASVM